MTDVQGGGTVKRRLTLGVAMPATSPIGDNLARLRHARGLTQEQLAEASGVSIGVITGLEQHRKPGARWATLQRLANALGVGLPVLITPPALLAAPGDTDAGTELQQLRGALTDPGDLLGDDLADTAETAPMPELAASVRQAWATYQRGHFATLTRALPSLIGDTRRVAHSASTDQQRAEAWRLASYCYSAAAGVTVMRGHPDLAWTAVERAAHAGRRAD